MSDQSELRERLAEVMAKHCEGYAPAYFLDYRGIDDVLTEIEAAGYVLVERDRWTAIQGLVVLMRMAFDCGADSPEGCGTTDGQILDRIMATLEMLEAEVSGDLEGEATP